MREVSISAIVDARKITAKLLAMTFRTVDQKYDLSHTKFPFKTVIASAAVSAGSIFERTDFNLLFPLHIPSRQQFFIIDVGILGD
jgi:hypothetical protein